MIKNSQFFDPYKFIDPKKRHFLTYPKNRVLSKMGFWLFTQKHDWNSVLKMGYLYRYQQTPKTHFFDPFLRHMHKFMYLCVLRLVKNVFLALICDPIKPQKRVFLQICHPRCQRTANYLGFLGYPKSDIFGGYAKIDYFWSSLLVMSIINYLYLDRQQVTACPGVVRQTILINVPRNLLSV